MKRKTGERAICQRCGQEVEWVGYWHDRGGNRECPPYRGADGEIVQPKRGSKHTPRSQNVELPG